MRRAAALRAHLDHPPVLARGREHGLALHHVHRGRLLHVHVGPRLHRRDHGQGVPVVGGGDEHDVEVLLLEHRAVVAVGTGLLLRDLARGDLLGGVGQHAAVHVAEGHHLHRRHLDQAEEVGLAVPAAADEADALVLAQGRGGVPREVRPGERGRARAQELTAIHRWPPPGLLFIDPPPYPSPRRGRERLRQG